MKSALIRYRVIAWVVGVLLVVLTLIGMPMKYAAGSDTIVAVVGPIHGFAYMVYLVLAADLARRARWSLQRTVLVLLAGTVPFVSFIAERIVTKSFRTVAVEERYAQGV